MSTFGNINDATGFANGERFTTEAQVRAYFTQSEQRMIFGRWATIAPAATLRRWAELVIANRWHCKF